MIAQLSSIDGIEMRGLSVSEKISRIILFHTLVMLVKSSIHYILFVFIYLFLFYGE